MDIYQSHSISFELVQKPGIFRTVDSAHLDLGGSAYAKFRMSIEMITIASNNGQISSALPTPKSSAPKLSTWFFSAKITMTQIAMPTKATANGIIKLRLKRATPSWNSCRVIRMKLANYSSLRFPRSTTSSKFPWSSNVPMPTCPQVNVLSLAVMYGFCMSSK
jgi:hypothetical protein